MPQKSRQKLRILTLLSLLERKTDEAHSLTTAELIAELNRQGLDADRKTVYDDLQSLEDAGYDILRSKGKNGGVRLLSGTFAPSEVKMLVDAVQSSRFITESQSKRLTDKLGGLVSDYQSKMLARHFYNGNRIKSDSRIVLYTVDTLNDAINQNRAVSFRYWNWSADKKKVFRHGGKLYKVSPWELTIDDNNYYLIAFDEEKQALRHYRVDKMAEVEISPDPRTAVKETADLSLHEYCTPHFGMFGGKSETVKLHAPISMAGIFIDRFGKDVILHKVDEQTVTVRTTVAPSPQFYGWLLGLGGQVTLCQPQRVKEEYEALLQAALNASAAIPQEL